MGWKLERLSKMETDIALKSVVIIASKSKLIRLNLTTLHHHPVGRGLTRTHDRYPSCTRELREPIRVLLLTAVMPWHCLGYTWQPRLIYSPKVCHVPLLGRPWCPPGILCVGLSGPFPGTRALPSSGSGWMQGSLQGSVLPSYQSCYF